jgi:hypothetical protein
MRSGMIRGLAFGLGILAPNCLIASEWRTPEFELRQDRLYFPAGEEALIFENSPFAVLRNGDTIYVGLIEHSWEGISASTPTHASLDTLSLAGLEAVISQADVDSLHTITVGSEFSDLALRADAPRNDLVRWTEYKEVGTMRDDFVAGLLDAIVTLSDFDLRPRDVHTLAAPCPFIAVIVPHVGRPFNYHGELATSLYYRFDDSRLALCFEGDGVSPVNRLTSPPADSPAQPRWYDSDPSRGKKLLERMSHRPSRVRLYSGHPALDGLTRYFADVLSRDRCAVEVTADRHLADLSLEFIPYDKNSPRLAMDTLLSLMVCDSLSGTPPAEYLRRIRLELSELESSLYPEDSSRHLETVSRIMAEDLGLFPLFRPTLYVHAQKRLRNVTLTPDGRVDCHSAITVRLPQPPSGVAR